LLTVWKL